MSEMGYLFMILLFIGFTPGLIFKISLYNPLVNKILHGLLFSSTWYILNKILYLKVYEEFQGSISDSCYHNVDCVTNNFCPHIDTCECINEKCKRKYYTLCNNDYECSTGKCKEYTDAENKILKRCVT